MFKMNAKCSYAFYDSPKPSQSAHLDQSHSTLSLNLSTMHSTSPSRIKEVQSAYPKINSHSRASSFINLPKMHSTSPRRIKEVQSASCDPNQHHPANHAQALLSKISEVHSSGFPIQSTLLIGLLQTSSLLIGSLPITQSSLLIGPNQKSEKSNYEAPFPEEFIYRHIVPTRMHKLLFFETEEALR